MTKPDDAPALTPSWQSAADIPAWVPLRQLRHAVALAIGEAHADVVASSIMRAVRVGAVATRYGADFAHWRRRAAELGHELQQPRDYRAMAGQLLAQRGAPLPEWCEVDEVRGIVLAPGDPAGKGRLGSWPLGPVDLAWSDVEALPAFRDAKVRPAATSASSTPAAIEDSAVTPADKPTSLPWAKDPEPWQRAQLALIELCDEEGAWPLPGQRGGKARLVRHLLDLAELEGLRMSDSTADRRVAAILAAPQSERVAWPSGSLRVKKGPDPL
jgi:hypothetical protein